MKLSVKARSKKSEAKAAALIGGKVQPGSGAINSPGLKGDAKSKDFVLQDKTTGAKSYRFTVADWVKARAEAYNQGRRPLFRIQFEGTPHALIVMEESLLAKLLANQKEE